MTERRTTGGKLAPNLALVLFLCTGLALPFYAFPVLRAAGRPVDLATMFAVLFVAASVFGLRRRRVLGPAALSAAALGVALLVLFAPRPAHFQPGRFAVSFGHWALVVGVFAAASLLSPTPTERRAIAGVNVVMGVAVAAYGLYQVIGHRLGWPGTGSVLVGTQREPLRLFPIRESAYLRPTSVFLEPAWLGGYLAFILAVLFGLLAAGVLRSRSARIAVIAALIVVLLCGLATVSWGAYADLSAVLVAGVWGLRRRFRAAPRAAVAAVAVLALVVAAGALSPLGRLASHAAAERWKMLLETPVGEETPAEDVSDSSWMRASNLRHTAELIREYPWKGVGLGQFRLYAVAKGPSYMAVSSTRDPWCGWLAITAEAGLLAPAVLSLYLIAVVWRRSSSGSSPDDPGASLARVAAPALVLLALVQQLHTASYIDLWWWYPLSVAMVLSAPAASPPVILEDGT